MAKRAAPVQSQSEAIDEDVGKPCRAYEEMKSTWALIDDLLGGTRAMREAGQTWLPAEPGEKAENYARRLDGTVLFPGYSDAERKLAAKPFSKPVTLAGSEAMPEMLQLIEGDADMTRTSITGFAKKLWHDAFNRGLTHFFVDFAKRDGPTTTADVQNERVHPYFVHAPTDSVIGWRSRFDQSKGRRVLTLVRILEERQESDGRWGETTVRYVRVLTENDWQLWQNVKGDKYRLVATGDHGLGRVPLVTAYFAPTGFMTGKPCLEDLAWLNLAHWQSSSDQKNILHVARVPFLSEAGVSPERLNDNFQLSAGRVRRTATKAGEYRIGWVEHSGAAIESGAKDLRTLEEQMQLLGMQPMLDPTSPRTATEASATRDENQTTLKEWAQSLQDALHEGFEVAALYLEGEKRKLPEEFTVSVHREWELSSGDPGGMDRIEKMFDRGVVTKRRYAVEAKRRGLFGEDYDVDRELQEIEDELPTEPTAEQLLELERVRSARASRSPSQGAPGAGAAE